MNTYGYNGSAAEASGETMGAMGAVAAPAPTPGYPVTGDPRQQAVNNPAQVRQDAANLRLLDYAAPDTGNAYDPKFREAVRAFQAKMGSDIVGPIDGLIGPTTRSVLVDVVRGSNKTPPGGQAVVPNVPGGLSNASTAEDGGLLSYWPYGLAAAGALGLAWFVLKR